MKERSPVGEPPAVRPVSEPAPGASPERRRRRPQLRHDAAVVVAEIRRMQRLGRSPAGDGISPRLA